ncbi:UDP-glucose/GDP-mannose dehydrogenase family, NAD binding domain-containing protein [Ustulina deusta]|nr:UDP-glucose/GDP-mannose dehydrogenase family, NAD binding domain-containing protein [Ustulina deusta]
MDNHQIPLVSNICFIGAGYVGGPTAAVIANRCPHIQVTVVDRDADRIKAWRSDELPVSEPDLLDVIRVPRDGLRSSKSRNLVFTTELENTIQTADMVIIAVDTPTKVDGEGSGYLLDTTGVEEVTKSIARFSTGNKIVVEKSTVPVGTSQRLREILNRNARHGVKFEVLSNPEFLAEGTAIQNLLFPDRVIIGSSETRTGLLAAEALANVYRTWVPQPRIILSNLFSSELSKLGANAILAQRISSINALSAMCEATGADIDQIARAIGSDSRIGPHMLQSSFGFGGSCFLKDIRSIIYLCQSLHLPEIAAYWKSILDINDMQKSRAIPRIASLLGGDIKRKKIAVLGFAFKKDTEDTRESCAIDLVQGFVREGALVSVYDPCVKGSQIHRDLSICKVDEEHTGGSVRICNSGLEACEGAYAVVVATDWDMFQQVEKVMEHPKVVLGSTQILDRAILEEMGFLVEIIGTKRYRE